MGMILGFVTDHFLSVFMQSVVLEAYVVTFVVIVLLSVIIMSGEGGG